ncbi:MAG: orotate phosphoribosyltransferase [Saprospiraceae bacterium]
MSVSKELARKLLQIKAIRLSPQKPFTWASGIKSPIYCDNRVVLSDPDTRNLVKEGLAELAKEWGEFHTVAGVATAGIAHGALLADAMGKPFVYVRSKRKGHGRQNLIEGNLTPNCKVVVVEDLISTGMSSLKAVSALKDGEARIIGCLALFSYGFQDATDAFQAQKCEFKTLTDYNTLLEVAVEEGFLEQEELETLKEWRVSPKTWTPRIIEEEENKEND